MTKKQLLLSILLSTQTLLIADYTLVDAKRTPSQIDQMPRGNIADMQTIPQDPAFYAKQFEKVSYGEQLQWDREYNQKYFRPWSLDKIDIPLDEMEWPFRSVSKIEIYDSREEVIPSSIYTQWIRNANFSQLDRVHQRGITTKHTNVRALPTSQPFYHDPSQAGEGFPFDYNQNSSYHINTPLYISHYSLDGKWAYVRGSADYGWVQSADVAIVDDAFAKAFKNDHYAIVVKDDLKLYDDKRYLTIVKLGAIFPQSKEDARTYLFAARSKNGKAILQSARTQKTGLIAKKPIAMNANNVTFIAKQFHDEPYGWGGLMQTRDCSSFTKDYFAPFGIFLRRNSSKQVGDGAYSIISGIPKSQKKQTIVSHAKPFRSMLYVPGHIVLYLGQYRGEPVIMHTYWGARLNDGSKKILGRNVITTTEPGKELSDIKESSKLANTLGVIVTPGG